MIKWNKQGKLKNFKNNLLMLISAFAFAFLNITNPNMIMLNFAFCILIFIVSFYLSIDRKFIKTNISAIQILVSIIYLLYKGYNFYSSMTYSSLIIKLSLIIGISNTILVLIITIVGIIVSIPFSYSLFILIKSETDVDQASKILESKLLKNIVVLIGIIGIILSIIFSFNGYVWADEAYSLRVVQYSWSEIIKMCAGDVHPPLYYCILKFVITIGSVISSSYYTTVVIGKLVSVIPYLLLVFLLCIKFRNDKKMFYVFILCLFGIPHLLYYSVEIRMYSWALFFVTAVFIYAREIMKGHVCNKNWILLIIFSILGAYTHDYALISIFIIWIYLFIWIMIYKRQLLITFLVSGIVVTICYFPWFLVLLQQFGEVSENYWISPITFTNIIEYINYMFSSSLIIIPLMMIVNLYDNKVNIKKVIEDGFGILIPVTTIVVGVIVSIIVRPVFISRYIVACLMCLWISIVLLSTKCNKKIQLIMILLIIITSINSYGSFIMDESKTKDYALDNISLVESFDDDSIIIISYSEHVADTVAAYTSNMVYNYKASELSEVRQAFKNEAVFDDISMVDYWLEKGKSIYYFELLDCDDEYNISDDSQNWNLEYIGQYSFEYDVNVYKIAIDDNIYEVIS